MQSAIDRAMGISDCQGGISVCQWNKIEDSEKETQVVDHNNKIEMSVSEMESVSLVNQKSEWISKSEWILEEID